MVAPSAETLKAVLDENGEAAQAIRAAVHRTQIWKHCTGRTLPDATTIAVYHELSGGRVEAHRWVPEEAA